MNKAQLKNLRKVSRHFSQVTSLIEYTKTNDSNNQKQKFIFQNHFLVKIYREDSFEDHQRALRSLDQITNNRDQVWNDRRKTLLMSNFGPEDLLVDFFATISPDSRDRAFADLYKLCSLEQKAALDAMCAVPHCIFILHGYGGSRKTWLCMNIIKILVFEGVMRVEGEPETKDMDTRELFQRRKVDAFQEANENTRPTPGKAQVKS